MSNPISDHVKRQEESIWPSILGVVSLIAVIGTIFGFVFHNIKSTNDEIDAILAGDPAYHDVCTVKSFGAAEYYRGKNERFEVDVITEQCGTLRLEQVPTLDDGVHLEVYKELQIGREYDFGTRDKVIYSVNGPLPE